ncbi:DoxX family protein [Phytomonospora endophytica]|uniref:Putative membrane protein YphA (DoxX/SURF4 family) n=1 Tax=Phytomonospora endophytica TaxID=714109 RepID=A0A841FIJ9_9ACTN|nr:DoxX family protein [Phytomonospora endophytica]MBB6032967.1 putative membrane protein YphA (DoxX/SURF4 family) [Phytomonospora endophytica]GIG65193.1 hypothetical protein Pen01_14880 [Phytomonospora endophytica]
MNIALWIAAGVLAAVLLSSGLLKLVTPHAKMAASRSGEWAGAVAPGAVKALGAVEVLGAIGLILPALLDIAPVLVPVAAVGAALLLIGAMVLHLRRRETVPAFATLLYLAVALFVAWGRFGPESFTG